MLLNHLRRTLSRFFASAQWRRLVIALILPCLISSCASASWLNSAFPSRPLELSIQQVRPVGSGSYAVSGSTSLPDQAQITVSAVRYFKNGAASSSPNYTVLDRQIAEVNQGIWETRLKLQQAAATGQLQEAWQASSQLSQLVEPEAAVTFLATLEPANQPVNLKKQVEALNPSAQAAIARFTTDGELYLQTSKTLAAPPPPGRAVPNASKPTVPQIVKPTAAPAASQGQQRQTDAPLIPDAYLR